MTFFALLPSCIPNEKDLAQLRVKLTDIGYNQCVTKIEFKTVSKLFFSYNFFRIQTNFWFDGFEGKPDSALEAKWLAEKKLKSEQSEEYDSEEEEDTAMGSTQGSRRQLDSDRVMAIKDLLFDIHRVHTGEDKLSIPEFIDFLIQVSTTYQNCDTFGNALFGG